MKEDKVRNRVCKPPVNWGHSRDLFEGHNSNQRTHQTDRWKYQEHLSIIKKKNITQLDNGEIS